MPRAISVLSTSLLLFGLILAVVADAAAGDDPDPEVIESTVNETPVPHRWVNEGGPYGGHVRDLAIDPTNPQVIYACGDGGLYKTTDAARTWSRVETPRYPYDPPRCVASTMGITEVECHGGTIYIICPGKGAFKSADGGRSWARIADDYHFVQIRLDPVTPATLYATDRGRGVLKSVDAGTTWHVIDAVTRPYLELAGDDPPVLWWNFPMEATLKLSDDGKAVTVEGDSFPSPGITVKEFTRDPDDPDNPDDWRLVLEWQGKWEFECKGRRVDEAAGRKGLRVERMFEWRDGKNHLTTIRIIKPGGEARLTRDGGETIRIIQSPVEGMFVDALRTDPRDPEMLYAATGDDAFYFSTDDGETWDLLYSRESDPHAEQTEAIALIRELFRYGLNPEPQPGRSKEAVRIRGLVGIRLERGNRIVAAPSNTRTLYATSKRCGVLKSEDGGHTWAEANRGLSMTHLAGIACSPADPDVVYALDDFRFYRSRDRGRSWERIEAPLEWQKGRYSSGTIAPHPGDPTVILVRKGGGLWLSRDAGTSWRRIDDEQVPFPNNILFSKDEPDRFFLLNSGQLTEMTNHGALSRTFDIGGRLGAHDMLFTRQSSVGIIYHLARHERKLWQSTDRGKTWEATNLPTERSLTGMPVIEVHPTEPSHLILEGIMYSADFSRNELFRSTDACRTWQHYRGVPIGYFVTFDPKNPEVLYFVSDVVYRTRDGGKTFERFDKGLPGQVIGELAVSPVDGTVYAVADHAGIYRLDLEQSVPGEAGDE